MTVPSKLARLGFSAPAAEVSRRMTVSVCARGGKGKSRLIYTAPGPIGVLSLDWNDSFVATMAQQEGKTVWRVAIDLPGPYRASGRQAERSEEENKTLYLPVWNKCVEAYYGLIEEARAGNLRTIGVDTGTEMYQIIRLARFGKLAQVLPEHYGPVQADLRAMYRAAEDAGAHLIVTHKMTKVFVKQKGEKRGEWNGEWEMAGFSDIEYIAQVALELTGPPEEEDFGFKVTKSTANPDLCGQEVAGRDMVSFAMIGTLVFPESSEEDWS